MTGAAIRAGDDRTLSRLWHAGCRDVTHLARQSGAGVAVVQAWIQGQAQPDRRRGGAAGHIPVAHTLAALWESGIQDAVTLAQHSGYGLPIVRRWLGICAATPALAPLPSPPAPTGDLGLALQSLSACDRQAIAYAESGDLDHLAVAIHCAERLLASLRAAQAQPAPWAQAQARRIAS